MIRLYTEDSKMKYSKQVLKDILDNKLNTYYFVAHSDLNSLQLRIHSITRMYKEYDVLHMTITLRHNIIFTPSGPITYITMRRNGIEYSKFPLENHPHLMVGDILNFTVDLHFLFDTLFDSFDIELLYYWNDKTIPRLIKQKAPIPVIADAIEDAGCTNKYIIQHFRDYWLHSHCCHVLDYIEFYSEVGGFMKEQEGTK